MISLVFLWSDLIDKEEIDRGSFGCVFTAKQSDGESAVVKKLRISFCFWATYLGKKPSSGGVCTVGLVLLHNGARFVDNVYGNNRPKNTVHDPARFKNLFKTHLGI